MGPLRRRAEPTDPPAVPAGADAAGQRRDDDIVRHGDLEIEADPRLEARLNRIQVVGRAAAVGVLLLALAGGLGNGPLSRAEARVDGHALEYERIGYRAARQSYRLRMPATAVHDGRVRVWLSRETLSAIEIDEMVPDPGRSLLGADRLVFEFDVADRRGDLEVWLHFEPRVVGRRVARLGVERGATFDLPQVFLP